MDKSSMSTTASPVHKDLNLFSMCIRFASELKKDATYFKYYFPSLNIAVCRMQDGEVMYLVVAI